MESVQWRFLFTQKELKAPKENSLQKTREQTFVPQYIYLSWHSISFLFPNGKQRLRQLVIRLTRSVVGGILYIYDLGSALVTVLFENNTVTIDIIMLDSHIRAISSASFKRNEFSQLLQHLPFMIHSYRR